VAPCHAAATPTIPEAAGTTDLTPSGDPLHRESPRSCVYSFLQACRAQDYTRACSYLDLRKLPHASRLKDGSALAQQLEQVLDRDTHFDVAELSGDPKGSRANGLPENRERVDSFTVNGQNVDLDLDRIRLRSGVWIWQFSSDTVARIPQLVRMTSDSPVEKYLPDPLVDWKLADTALWKWVALILLALGLAALSRLICRSALLCAQQLLKRLARRMNPNILEAFVGPLRLLLSLALFRLGMEWIGPSPRFLNRGLALLFFLGLFWLLAGVVDLAMTRLRAFLQARHHAFSYSVLPLASRILKITILMLMIAAVLSEWGYNTTTILAGMGVGGIAVALAAQKTIENFFGGVAVISDRPVALGDFCKFGDRVGTVEDIGLRSTRIRSLDRTLITVPNGQFSSVPLENFSARDKVLFHFTLNLRRDTKPDQVRELLDSITKILKEHKKAETGNLPVRFVGVGTYSLDLEMFAYILTADYDEFLQIQQDLFCVSWTPSRRQGLPWRYPRRRASITPGPVSLRKTGLCLRGNGRRPAVE
jgi:MscS family membrane protein